MFLFIEIKSNFTDPEHTTAKVLRDIAAQIERGVISGTPTDQHGQPVGPPWSFEKYTDDDKADIDDDQRVMISTLVDAMDGDACRRLLNDFKFQVVDDAPAEALRVIIVDKITDGTMVMDELVIVESSCTDKEAKH